MLNTQNHIKLLKDSAEIFIYNDIDSFFGFTADELRQQLSSLPPQSPITVRLNSGGGEVFEGLAIYSLLNTWQGEVTTIVDGIAASISSVIFLAGDKRLIQDHGMLMVHLPRFGSVPGGTADEVEKNAERVVGLIRQSEESIKQIYLRNSSVEESELLKMLEDETFLSADEAVNLGFATEIVSVPALEARVNLRNLAAKLKGAYAMNPFEKWLAEYCEPLGLDPNSLTDDQKTLLKAKHEEHVKLISKSTTTPPPLPGRTQPPSPTPGNPGDPDELEARRLEARRKKQAEEDDRIDGIRSYADNHRDLELNEDYLKELKIKGKTSRALVSHAIREGWSVDKFELEMRRAERHSAGRHIGIHVGPSRSEINVQAMSASLCRQAGIPEHDEVEIPGTGKKRSYGFRHMYDEKDLEASHHAHYRDLSLQQVLERAYVEANGHRYEGRTNTDGFIAAVRESLWKLRASTGSTNWSGLNIFDDVANKLLWARYEAIPTTWQEWVKQMPVTDFKTHNTYRLTGKGAYQQVGANGELKHGELTDDKYQHSADTYGKIVGLDRRDIINDDLGALSDMMGMLGEEGALFLEELFYVHLITRLGTIFTAGRKNYIEGAGTALGVDGLTEGEKTLANQVNADNAPILINGSLLLVGTTLAVKSGELFTQTMLQGLQTANAKARPDGNPHVGKFRPVMSPYIDNTNIKQRITSIGDAISGQSATMWLLLRPPGPSGGIVLGSFLNGVTRPTVEQGDMSFDKLGLQWRAYHDAGADDGDPKWGVHSKGAA